MKRENQANCRAAQAKANQKRGLHYMYLDELGQIHGVLNYAVHEISEARDHQNLAQRYHGLIRGNG